MSDRTDPEEGIARLMAQGLDHYGQDRVEQAVECWRRVLALEPGHAEARDYLRTAGFEEDARQAPVSTDPSWLDEARALFRQGRGRDALELLGALAADRPDDLELQGHLELMRTHLFRDSRQRLAGGRAVPRLRLGADQLLKYNLPASAGFLLSMVDGVTPVDDLLALSGMDPFEALQVLDRLLDAGIVEAAA